MPDDTDSAAPPGPEGPAACKPRKIFLLLGLVVAAGLGVGLFTSIGTSGTPGASAPRAGELLPPFSGTNLNGPGRVAVPAGVGHGRAAVLLFFGDWCPSCHQELPPLAAAVRAQTAVGGALSRIRVIGVDSEDTTANAKSFIQASGVTFPVAYDPDLSITSGDYWFHGDPGAVFVRADGRIDKVVRVPLSRSAFTADERALIPSGR